MRIPIQKHPAVVENDVFDHNVNFGAKVTKNPPAENEFQRKDNNVRHCERSEAIHFRYSTTILRLALPSLMR